MTSPVPFNERLVNANLKRKWLNKFLNVSESQDRKIKLILSQGARDARKALILLDLKDTFSSKVRAAQIRFSINEIRAVHEQIFGDVLPVIKQGHKDAAAIASGGLSELDRDYLEELFSSTRAVENFIASQQRSAQAGVAHAISKVTKSDRPLSARVYRTRSLANQWVSRIITSSILRGDSSRDIAKAVEDSILPTTPGGTSYAAMRLGRTELANAFHATAITQSADRPWVDSMEWNLSTTHHVQGCKCEIYRQIRLFPVERVPEKPHPQCRCFVTPVLESFDTFLMKYKAGYYRDFITEVA